jgi:putative redox protein
MEDLPGQGTVIGFTFPNDGWAMKARIKWVEDATFLGESGSGHAVVMDGPPEYGGRNLGVRPMEMILLGMGGARQPVTNCVVEVEAERADQVPKVFTRIHVHFIVTGDGLSDIQVARAVELSAKKYCSASIMLGKVAEISHDYQIVTDS